MFILYLVYVSKTEQKCFQILREVRHKLYFVVKKKEKVEHIVIILFICGIYYIPIDVNKTLSAL